MYGIICIGDSITFGRGGTGNKGWVFRLNEHFSPNDYYNAVYNLGIPGNNSINLLERFDAECKARVQYF